MRNIFGSRSKMGSSTRANHVSAISAIDALYEQEMETNLAALAEQRRKSRRHSSAANWLEYWPFALGVAISCFVPQMREFVEANRPWGMWILFPFAAIINSPEVALSSASANMPLLFMFAQFPLEGLVARIAFRGRVTVLRVLGQVFILHLFALIELWLVNSPLSK